MPNLGLQAAGFIKSAAAGPKPFFLYVPFSHLHNLCPPSFGQWVSTFWNLAPAPTRFLDHTPVITKPFSFVVPSLCP